MVIDTEKLSGITLPELSLLLLLYDTRTDQSRTVSRVDDVDVYNIMNSLQEKGYIISSIYATDYNYNPPLKHVCWSLVEKGKQAIAEACMKQSRKTATNELRERFKVLAKKLMELYPLGTKPGTSNKWRGYENGIVEKLLKLTVNEDFDFTDEEAVEAVKEYIGSFNGVYDKMKTLPYFLAKNEIVGGEVKKHRDFTAYIEDMRSGGQKNMKYDWDVSLK